MLLKLNHCLDGSVTMNNQSDNQTQDPASPDRGKIQFTYLRSQYYREVIINGAHGGITPSGEIHLGLYSEYRPYPKEEIYTILEDGTIGTKLSQEMPTDGVLAHLVREIEIGVTLNLSAAISLATWLQKKIELAQDMAGIELSSETQKKEGTNASQ